ncbi:hypothetical protein [Streptomyces sp. NBC_01216]|uniref:hypothetical protein n=1 Tax=unclassified Streptomyces TaxID=2593676 RepID=UPI002E14964C|nr:hypothetical protein OG393_09515 [Streptomyces sp. NBC_01216]
MLQRTEWATGTDRDAAGSPQLPDLAAFDLRTLRRTEDPDLEAAVRRVLLRSGELVEFWAEGAGGNHHHS